MQEESPLAVRLTSILLKENRKAKNKTLRHLGKEHHLHHHQRLEDHHLVVGLQKQKAKRLNKLECLFDHFVLLYERPLFFFLTSTRINHENNMRAIAFIYSSPSKVHVYRVCTKFDMTKENVF